MSFKLAGSQAFKQGATKAHPVLLEPIVNVRVEAPENYTGDLVSDLNTKRAHVLGITPEENHHTVIDAQAPMAEMLRYATDLRSLTQGRASFSMQFDHYAEVPEHIMKKVLEEAQKAKAETH
jgi:elongation factor G